MLLKVKYDSEIGFEPERDKRHDWRRIALKTLWSDYKGFMSFLLDCMVKM